MGLDMIVWRYRIVGNSSILTTKNTEIAENKSKLGYIVYCKRESNIYKYKNL